MDIKMVLICFSPTAGGDQAADCCIYSFGCSRRNMGLWQMPQERQHCLHTLGLDKIAMTVRYRNSWRPLPRWWSRMSPVRKHFECKSVAILAHLALLTNPFYCIARSQETWTVPLKGSTKEIYIYIYPLEKGTGHFGYLWVSPEKNTTSNFLVQGQWTKRRILPLPLTHTKKGKMSSMYKGTKCKTRSWDDKVGTSSLKKDIDWMFKYSKVRGFKLFTVSRLCKPIPK